MIIEEKKSKNAEFKSTEQKLSLENRKRLCLNDVKNIESFSEHTITLDTDAGKLVIKGENLHIGKLNVDDGNFCLDGFVNSLEYQKKSSKRGGFFENLFK